MKTTPTKTNVIKKSKQVVEEVVSNLSEIEKKKNPKQKSLKLTKTSVKKKPEPIKWDFPITADVSFFDASLSYELTGYRPITKTEGLDFNPEWFIEARNEFLATGHYTSYLVGSKGYRDFWHEEYRRCKSGYTVNGYTVTGEHYFFLNYYKLPIISGETKAGSGRSKGFPSFFVSQYQFFHYVDLAKKTHKHIALMKARGVGFSELSASMAINQYTTVKESITMIACYDKGKLERTLSKAWDALRFLDTSTDGGMFKLRQLSDTAMIKKSGHFNMSKGNKTPAGWQSMVEGVVADDPQKIRGDRVDLMILDEFGSWPDSVKAFVQAQALVEVQGVAFGTIQVGGTGGDKGSALAGLNTIYYHPEPYGVLPYRHNYTSDNSTILSAYFIPAFTQSMVPGMTDERGYCDEEKNKAYLQKKRDQYLNVPQSLIHHCAEYCWNAEEAFALEGDNKFNKVLLSEQLAQIRLHHTGPRPVKGYIDYTYKDNQHSPENITGFKWIPTKEGKIEILEHPIWSECYKQELKRKELEAINNGQKFEEKPIYKEIKDLYVAGVDGIDIGKNQTSSETRGASEFCLVIYKRVYGLSDPQIVCVYKDRPNEVRTAYKIAMCLIRYYNCKVNVEATRVGFINWARYSNQLKWFMKRPQATLQNVRNGNSKSYGTPATATIIDMHTDLTANFVEDYCYTIWYEEVLDQLVRYNDENKTKFDIIAALGMALLADQELTGRAPMVVAPIDESFEDFGYYIDENGYRQWGVIPKDIQLNMQYGGGQAYDPYRLNTSDTRYHQRYN